MTFQDLPSELVDYIFTFVAGDHVDSAVALLPLAAVAPEIYPAVMRSAFNSICLLKSNPSLVKTFTDAFKRSNARQNTTQDSWHQQIICRRLLLSFLDLSATPTDNTVEDLLQAAAGSIQELVIYLCEAEASSTFIEHIETMQLSSLDYGSFSSKVSVPFDILLNYMRRSPTLLDLSWEVAASMADLPKTFEIEQENLCRVQSLSIVTPAISDSALLAIIDTVRPTLKHLRLRTTTVSSLLTPQGIVAALCHCPNLLTLDIDLCLHAEDDAQTLDPLAMRPIELVLPSLPLLSSLSLSGPAPLASMLGLARIETLALKYLRLTGPSIESAGHRAIIFVLAKTLRCFTSLKRLEIELGVTIGIDGGQAQGNAAERELISVWSRRGIELVFSRPVQRMADRVEEPVVVLARQIEVASA